MPTSTIHIAKKICDKDELLSLQKCKLSLSMTPRTDSLTVLQFPPLEVIVDPLNNEMRKTRGSLVQYMRL